MNSILVLSFMLLTQIPLSSRGIARNHVDFNLVSKVQLPEDAFLTIDEYLSKYQYPFESHNVTTEDGFILSVHRIPQTSATNNSAVLFVPPLLCSSFDWVNQGPNKSLALVLYDLGYDIWMTNSRGTRYSMNHLYLDSSQQEFWNFSFHERGYYDLSASIDYILNSTGVSKVTVVTFSESTSSSMALLSTRPEYNEKIELLVLLSPVGYMEGVTSVIPVFLAQYLSELQAVSSFINFYGSPYNDWLPQFLVGLCSIQGVDIICKDFMGLLLGFDPDQLDLDYLLILLSDKPAGVSAKQLIHYGQEILSGSFRQYDYGTLENTAYYGTPEPPNYELSNITAPLAAYYGKNDCFAAVDDVEKLLSKLPNVVEANLIQYEKFSHLDFVGAKDVKSLLYDRVIEVIEKYTK